MTIERPRCVLDTNVLISAGLIRGSVPDRVLRWVVRHGVLLTSEAAISEFASRFVHRSKFDRYLTVDARRRLVGDVVEAAVVVEVTSRVRVCRDPDDDAFAALAVDGGADCLVTGNLRDFPEAVAGVPVLSPSAFLARYVR